LKSFTVKRNCCKNKVSSNLGADGGGNFTVGSGEHVQGELTVKYSYYQVYGAGDPSICEVYFAISNRKVTNRMIYGIFAEKSFLLR